MLIPNAQWVDPETGHATPEFFELIFTLWTRSGGGTIGGTKGGQSSITLTTVYQQTQQLSVSASTAFALGILNLAETETPQVSSTATSTSSSGALAGFAFLGLDDPDTSGVSSVPGWDPNVTATGTNQATAYQIVKEFTVFTTVAASTGTVLPAIGFIGQHCKLIHRGANILQIYGAGSNTIEGTAGATGIPLPIGGATDMYAQSLTNWVST